MVYVKKEHKFYEEPEMDENFYIDLERRKDKIAKMLNTNIEPEKPIKTKNLSKSDRAQIEENTILTELMVLRNKFLLSQPEYESLYKMTRNQLFNNVRKRLDDFTKANREDENDTSHIKKIPKPVDVKYNTLMDKIKKYFNEGKIGEKEITILAKSLNKGKYEKVEKYFSSLETPKKATSTKKETISKPESKPKTPPKPKPPPKPKTPPKPKLKEGKLYDLESELKKNKSNKFIVSTDTKTYKENLTPSIKKALRASIIDRLDKDLEGKGLMDYLKAF
jgi:hypothetical protein